VASVLLLLPDELLAEIDAIRQGPRLGWIRDALSSKLTMAQAQARVDEEQVRIAAERDRARSEADERNNAAALAALERAAAPSPARTPAGRARTMTRQGTLPGGDACAHPFRDKQNRCRKCGSQR
jgi:hypothetical protein